MVEPLKISYHAATMRVRCEFSRGLCLQHETPPTDVIKRAKAKLEAVKQAGEIAFFVVYETRLKETWRLLREAAGEPEDRLVFLTLAGGAPPLAGLEVAPSTADKVVITIATDTTVAAATEWKWDWFKLWVSRRLRELGVKGALNNGQLYSAFLKARQVGKMPPQAIGLNSPPAAPGGVSKAFAVIGNKQRREIGVLLRDVSGLRERENREAMLTLINQAVRQMSVEGVEYRLLKKEFLAALQSSIDGPEGLGIEMPLVLLAAVGNAPVAATEDPRPARLHFEIKSGQMEAMVAGFQKSYYDLPGVTLDLEWITKEMAHHGLLLPMAADVAKGLSEALRRRDDLNGLLVARGTPGHVGKEPFLYPAYKDAESRAGSSLTDVQVDLRDLQQRSTVKAGQLVAEVRYKTPPAVGRNVYNEEVPSAPSEELTVQIGIGIQVQGSGRYIAAHDGMPLVEKAAVSLIQVLRHEGDVNLSTGNIAFDGPVEITGSIDPGAVVTTTQDLTVHGSVTGACLHVKGNLTVHSGISTGPKGLVEVRGDMKAEFIEQSNIVCRGNLTVQKAILNSQVYVTGEVHVVGEGAVIAGGKVFCLGSLTTGNLGSERGTNTALNVGIDWKVARSVEIKQRRAEKVLKKLQDDRLALRDLVQKRPDQMTARHKELKEELQERLGRLRTLAEKLEALGIKMTAELSYSTTARIYVRETLYTNVTITLCGQVIAVTNNLANVAVLPKRRRGSFIVALEEIEEDIAAGREPGRPKRAG